MTTSITIDALANEMRATFSATNMSLRQFSAFTGINGKTLARAFYSAPIRPSTVIAISAELRRAREEAAAAISAVKKSA
jgi:hypothetical protein